MRFSLNHALCRYERRLVYLALKRTRGNVAAAADMLCIQRTNLEMKINKLDLRNELNGLRSKDPGQSEKDSRSI